ncbi:aminopeptidase N [Roseiterribacter gracilis]|uniref:Aminopeptidase N n=1 Tax=Roseiterribacter gracilis TaxID=2812848 RepID=A0A8S8X7I3_9PROT|nr:aminopeptidase N [Rhodospirillales bacterium TMPK1]
MDAVATAPRTIRRDEYRPPAHTVRRATLTFDLRDEATTVAARLRIARNESGQGVLHLHAATDLEILSLRVDGVETAYERDEETIRVPADKDELLVETVTRLRPAQNTALEGLYRSSGVFCTQCEPEGFRKITPYIDRPDVMAPFTVRIEADRASCPVLLSNGNPIESGDLEDGRHFAVWDDPFPKSAYLFALVAGDLGWVEDHFTTMHGREVTLRIHADRRDLGKLDHAMESLKKSMKWDEDVYGRAYEHDVFNIVAVADFNMGAMENTGLNIFNTKYVLADKEISTDLDYQGVEGVIAHEYFHNWSGNRVTCRDWFQLSLKEGFTVYRDQCFSADQSGAAVQRISDVETLRRAQFPEDAGPTAHPIRPDSYIEINNFYTPTVYEKGAEVVRMLQALLGPEKFRKGTDLYFTRNDGNAVTCDDFVDALQDASGIDLTDFRRWYGQAGTPRLTARTSWDEAARQFEIELTQSTAPTPGQPNKEPLVIPVRTALFGTDGKLLALDAQGTLETVLTLDQPSARFVFENLPSRPIPSLLRGYSAPVRLELDLDAASLAFLAGHDNDPFNRWDAAQQLALRALQAHLTGRADDRALPALLVALRLTLSDPNVDRGLAAAMLELPDEATLALDVDQVAPDALAAAVDHLHETVSRELGDVLLDVYKSCDTNEPIAFDAASIGRRALRVASLQMLMVLPDEHRTALAETQARDAPTMTERMGALRALVDADAPAAAPVLDAFYTRHHGDALTIDKWFALQATARRPEALTRVRELLDHPDFTLGNPNRLRSLVGAYAASNFVGFHRADGEGYRLLADIVLDLDSRNPQVASRLLGPLKQWRRFAEPWREHMRAQLTRIAAKPDLSRDVYETVSKSLA